MATQAQTFANRENSKHSTGPRTPEGKAASSLNRTVHGLSATDPMLSHENRDEFNALLAHFHSEFAPVTSQQEDLVYLMAGARWKLNRADRIEIALFGVIESANAASTPEESMAHAMMDKNTGAGFDRLARYRANLERTYHRCCRELRVAQKLQNEANSTQAAEKKFQNMLARMMDAPPPGYTYEPRLVPAEPSGETNGS